MAVVFYPIIERELNKFQVYWNTHKIRKSSRDTIDGIPNDLYEMPSYYGKCEFNLQQLNNIILCIGAEDYTQPISSGLWSTAMSTKSKVPEATYSIDFYERSARLIEDNFGIDLHRDINFENCIEVYVYLVDYYE